MKDDSNNISKKVKHLLFGKAKSIHDPDLFHKLSLIAFFAWVGLGADGISSSCYGPEEAFLALKGHPFLGIFVAIATAVTIFVISQSYSQIIELFPAGGGGYLVASKLLSPSLGMVAGCALLIDYVLTITISVASGADALFSFLPLNWFPLKLEFAIIIVAILTLLNMRGVKESVLPLVPIFLTFIATHVFVIIYGVFSHASSIAVFAQNTTADINSTVSQVGVFGMFVFIMRAYSMGAGTFTGIEAVSNGIPVLREPRVDTAKKTMRYMAMSLSFMVVGLMFGYLLYNVHYQPGKTLNAVLFEAVTSAWADPLGRFFVLVTLISEAVLLFVAAQTGFLDGPRVLSNMALDRWFPARFAVLSERLVMQNGILLMGIASVALMIFSRGSVRFLVVLYSINVFITFCLSQLGMVRHWWNVRKEGHWKRRIAVNGVGLILSAFILISVVVLKFNAGGWITIFITGLLMILAVLIKRHYKNTLLLLRRLNDLLSVADAARAEVAKTPAPVFAEPSGSDKIAVILINGYNGLGLHTLFNVTRLFGDNFKYYFFVQTGVIDAGNFKGVQEIENLKKHINDELDKYVAFMKSQGFYAKGFSSIGTDVIEEIHKVSGQIFEQYPHAVFFGGQMVFPKETYFTRMLHNQTVFMIQRRLYQEGIPFLIMPIRVS